MFKKKKKKFSYSGPWNELTEVHIGLLAENFILSLITDMAAEKDAAIEENEMRSRVNALVKAVAAATLELNEVDPFTVAANSPGMFSTYSKTIVSKPKPAPEKTEKKKDEAETK